MPTFKVGQLYKLSIKPDKNSGSSTKYDTFEKEEQIDMPSGETHQQVTKYIFKKGSYTEEQIQDHKAVSTAEALQPARESSLESPPHRFTKGGKNRRRRKTQKLHKKRKQHKRTK